MYLIDNEKEICDNIKNISLMEEYYDALYEALLQKGSFTNFDDQEKEMLSCLIEYYEGGQWLKDYEADEQGLIPKELKRGILGQDTLYNFLYTEEKPAL